MKELKEYAEWAYGGSDGNTIENHLGEKIRLSGNPDYSITNVTGISPPYANISLSENATMDGGTFNVSKLTSRNIVIELAMEGDAEKSRIALYRYVKAKKKCVAVLEDYLERGYTGKIFILYGLRRTGKTTLLKQAIKDPKW